MLDRSSVKGEPWSQKVRSNTTIRPVCSQRATKRPSTFYARDCIQTVIWFQAGPRTCGRSERTLRSRAIAPKRGCVPQQHRQGRQRGMMALVSNSSSTLPASSLPPAAAPHPASWNSSQPTSATHRRSRRRRLHGLVRQQPGAFDDARNP
jgi:hypothetical protein